VRREDEGDGRRYDQRSCKVGEYALAAENHAQDSSRNKREMLEMRASERILDM
jgi:hypothetical protein